jgi:hypothetical protein
MKTSRRFVVLSFVLLATASAASAGERMRRPDYPCNKYIDDCRDQERPRGCERYGECPPKPCTNIYDGCLPMVPHPMEDVSDKTAGIATSIGKGDFTKASEGLDGLFSGSGIKAGGTKASSSDSAVYAGAWSVEPRAVAGFSKFRPAPRGDEMHPSVERLDANQERGFKITPVGYQEEVAKELIKEAVKEAIPVVKEAVQKADQALSDKLTAPDTERARQEFGGCRMKGTCSK